MLSHVLVLKNEFDLPPSWAYDGGWRGWGGALGGSPFLPTRPPPPPGPPRGAPGAGAALGVEVHF